ncbi:hypothetical protein [Streptomyces sp. CBMA156]|uniref:hypothetical protein n=1 Tax=Streptomyces sp. CBMA156 TaxID=1930280 RepID=UPI001661DBE7|nr:hypothetical protein [Streptomyces sp. CBMA156]MBD0670409.1 hypothetical protein [Streptomyces sp. CBMA156]
MPAPVPVATGAVDLPARPNGPDPPPTAKDPPLSHRFILLGQKTLLAYHLGLFHVPVHAYQVTLRIDFSSAEVRQAYLADLATSVPAGKKRFYSIRAQGDMFDLTEITRKDNSRTSFDVAVERILADTTSGDREFDPLKDSQGKDLTTTVTIQPQELLYFEQIGTATSYPAQFTGLLTGTTDETCLAHKLAKADHWDAVLTVSDLKPAPSQATLDSAPLVTVPKVADTLTGDLNTQQSQFTTGNTYDSSLTSHANGATGSALSFTAGAEHWWNSTSLNTAT